MIPHLILKQKMQELFILKRIKKKKEQQIKLKEKRKENANRAWVASWEALLLMESLLSSQRCAGWERNLHDLLHLKSFSLESCNPSSISLLWILFLPLVVVCIVFSLDSLRFFIHGALLFIFRWVPSLPLPFYQA